MMPRRPTERSRTLAVQSLWLALWMYLYLVAVLGGWVLVTWAATGWSPTTVTSGSMSPSIRAGDVVFHEPPEVDELAQRTIVLFDDGNGGQVLHRIFEVTDQGLITKGDANTDPDSRTVAPEEVVGVGRLVVPLIGLPLVWLDDGNVVAVVAWLFLTIGGAIAALSRSTGWRAFQRDARRPGSAVTQKAVRQVRALVALMIISQFVIDPSRFDPIFASSAFPAEGVLIASLLVLIATNALSLAASNLDSSSAEGRSLLELVLDTALVIGLTTTTGTNGIGWVLFALPIIEAAARFRLAGALTHWMALTGVTIATRVALGANADESSVVLIGDLDRLVDQLSVLLLVVVPGADLAEQLVSDVLLQRRATGAAEERSRILHQVAELGQEVTQIDRNLFDTLTRGMLELGIDGADVVASQPGSPWAILSSASILEHASLPFPGTPGSGLRPGDMGESAVQIDRDDPDEVDRAAIAVSPWSSLVRLKIDGPNGSVLAVRAATTSEEPISGEVIDALQLLLGQATVGIENNHLVQELRTLNERIKTQATQDALTGLPNRRLLHSLIHEALDAGRRESHLLFLDLNGFKPINDRFGHDVGDELLVAISGRLGRLVGDDGVVARIGGDEFCVLLNDDLPVDPVVMAERVADVVAEPFAVTHGTVAVSAAIGMTTLAETPHPEEAIRRADVAMYRAKNDPTIRWAFYVPAMDEASRRAAELAPYLATAIDNDELTLHFQPLVTSATRQLAGVEALLRWTSAEFGPIRPDEIVHVAESNGLHDRLNLWILEHATAQVAHWRTQFAVDDLFLTVNASPTELQSRQLASNVSRALLLSGLPPSSLIVELSERLTTEQDHEMTRSLDELAELGIRVILDDFGQGQTSLAHLRQLPLVGIKLDRQLVVQAAERDEDRVILSSMVGLAHELNLRVVAEGVETEDQFAVVADAGGDLIQGYLVGRPVVADVITAEFFSGGLQMADSAPLMASERSR